MSQALNQLISKYENFFAIAFDPSWTSDNDYAAVISGPRSPILPCGRVVQSVSQHCQLIIQGSELGNIVMCVNFPDVSGRFSTDRVTFHYSEAMGLYLKEKLSSTHVEELAQYLFGDPRNFSSAFCRVEPAVRKRYVEMHQTFLKIAEEEYAIAPAAPVPTNERLGYYRYGTSEVILIKKGETEFIVSERRMSDDDELPIYSISNHETEVMAVAEFKRTIGNLLG